MSSFLFNCLLLNYSFPTNPNKITNCFKLFSLLQLYNYIAPASLFWFFETAYPLSPPNSLTPLFRNDYTKLGKQADAIAEVDHNIGILLKKINHLGLRDRTMIVVTGFAPDYFEHDIGQAPVR